jgi:hypothetical protein
MSHEIFGERFKSRSKPAWYGLGEVFDADLNILPSEAVAQVSKGIQIENTPIYLKSESGGFEPIDTHAAIVRKPVDGEPHKILGISSKDWQAISYVDLAKHLDRLDTSVYKVETAGILYSGGACFLSLRGEDWAVLGDEMQTYNVLLLSLKPGIGHRVLNSDVRVVCHNTQQLAISKASINLHIPHKADVEADLSLCTDLILQMKEAHEETKAIFEQLAKTPASHENMTAVYESAFPDAKPSKRLQLVQNMAGSMEVEKAFKNRLDTAALDKIVGDQDRYQKESERVQKLRMAALDRQSVFEPANLRGTLWSTYNAVTEVSDWRKGKNGAESSLFGSRAKEKERAFSACLSLIN